MATAIEQLSLEQAFTYSGGFALAPQNAIVNCTVKINNPTGELFRPVLYDEMNGDEFGGLETIYWDGNYIARFAIAVKEWGGKWTIKLKDNEDWFEEYLGEKDLFPGHIYNYTNIQTP